MTVVLPAGAGSGDGTGEGDVPEPPHAVMTLEVIKVTRTKRMIFMPEQQGNADASSSRENSPFFARRSLNELPRA